MAAETAAAPPPAVPVRPRTSALAVWSLVLAILGVCCLLGPLTGIPAIVCGALALGRTGAKPGALGGRGMAVAGLIVGSAATLLAVFFLPFMAAISLPAFAQARTKAQETKSLNDVRQIAVACIVYATEHEDQLPPTLDALTGAGAGTLPAVPTSPFAKEGSGPGYELVARGKLGELPADAVLVRQLDASRSGRRALAFADGHAESLTDAEAAARTSGGP
jgi:hypothetical protein